MSTERNLWGWLKRGTADLRGLHMQRVENGVAVGVPDTEGCHLGRQFWMELKCEARPKRSTTLIRVREEHFELQQVKWLMRRWRAGGNASVLVQVGSGARALRYLLAAPHAGLLVDGLTEHQLAMRSLCPGSASAKDIVLWAASARESLGPQPDD